MIPVISIHPNRPYSDWKSVNVQPNWPEGIDRRVLLDDDLYLFGSEIRKGDSPKPVCPHYELIELCGQIAGISKRKLAADPHFCGMFKGFEVEGSCTGNRKWPTGSQTPLSACRTFVDMIDEQLKLVENPPNIPEVPVLSKHPSLKASEKAAALMEERAQALKAKRERAQILRRWRTVIFDLTTVPKDAESGGLFQSYSSASHIPEEEVLSRVREFRDGLNKTAVGKPTRFEWREAPAKICPVAPQHEQVGEIFRRRRRFVGIS